MSPSPEVSGWQGTPKKGSVASRPLNAARTLFVKVAQSTARSATSGRKTCGKNKYRKYKNSILIHRNLVLVPFPKLLKDQRIVWSFKQRVTCGCPFFIIWFPKAIHREKLRPQRDCGREWAPHAGPGPLQARPPGADGKRSIHWTEVGKRSAQNSNAFTWLSTVNMPTVHTFIKIQQHFSVSFEGC